MAEDGLGWRLMYSDVFWDNVNSILGSYTYINIPNLCITSLMPMYSDVFRWINAAPSRSYVAKDMKVLTEMAFTTANSAQTTLVDVRVWLLSHCINAGSE